MPNDAEQNAIRIMMDERMPDADRIASARHLENERSDISFESLLAIARKPEGDRGLLQAAGHSLAKVAEKVDRQGDVSDLNPDASAAYRERSSDV